MDLKHLAQWVEDGECSMTINIIIIIIITSVYIFTILLLKFHKTDNLVALCSPHIRDKHFFCMKMYYIY